MENLEKYFDKYRKNIVGINAKFFTPFGEQKMIYADWLASGRLYAPIEEKIKNLFGEVLGNTHSEASETGVMMTKSYNIARQIIKEHTNANDDDIIITEGSGMTGVINKLQRILGLKISDRFNDFCKKIKIKEEDKPVVFITHMEHHSNQTSWIETIADLVVLEPCKKTMVNSCELEEKLEEYKNRKLKIGSFTACSNVTGIITPYYELAKIMHKHNGYCFIDFAASAPYVKIDMHPKDPEMRLDAIFFSPHKFLGGPGSSGVLIFNKKLYDNKVPDNPGGGTVKWTNPWGEHSYIQDIETREDGGTPAFLQTIKTALCIKLKEEIGLKNIHDREEELLKIVFEAFSKIEKLHLMMDKQDKRIGALSFYIEDIHHNLFVKLLNDRFGIQVRGGCSCAGTYGHFLFNIAKNISDKITKQINSGDLTNKPGWVRLSVHPTMKNEELFFIIEAIKKIMKNIDQWKKEYNFSSKTGEFYHINEINKEKIIKKWFNFDEN